jgi:hypothetical protein
LEMFLMCYLAMSHGAPAHHDLWDPLLYQAGCVLSAVLRTPLGCHSAHAHNLGQRQVMFQVRRYTAANAPMVFPSVKIAESVADTFSGVQSTPLVV